MKANTLFERTPAPTTGKGGRRLAQSGTKLTGAGPRYQLSNGQSSQKESQNGGNALMHLFSAQKLKGRGGKSTTDAQGQRAPFP